MIIASANFSVTAIATPTLTTAESLGSTPGAFSILPATFAPAIFSCVLQGRSVFQDAHVIIASANFSVTAIATPTLMTAESLGSAPGAGSILLATFVPAIFSCVLQGD